MEHSAGTISQQALDEISERGAAIYAAQLKAAMEPQRNNQYIAIHIDSGDYAAAKTTAAATRALLQRHPADGRIYLRKIGDEPEYELSGRILSGERQAGQPK